MEYFEALRTREEMYLYRGTAWALAGRPGGRGGGPVARRRLLSRSIPSAMTITMSAPHISPVVPGRIAGRARGRGRAERAFDMKLPIALYTR